MYYVILNDRSDIVHCSLYGAFNIYICYVTNGPLGCMYQIYIGADEWTTCK